jgi:LmbE family N-acetylglucosaminyl deacetylase
VHAEELFRRASYSAESPRPMPRALAVFAHPDDETIALGARLSRFRTGHLMHVTDGAPRNQEEIQSHGFGSREAYSRARAEELNRALTVAGLDAMSRDCLGITDQEASFHLPRITRSIAQILQTHRPEVIFTHPYEGGHPDHDACAFAVAHAVEMRKSCGGPGPLILECAFYHAGREGIETGTFLPHPFVSQKVTYSLSESERMRKQALLACFTTQQAMLRYFRTDVERFRVAPEYDFSRPPHPGPVFYTSFQSVIAPEYFCGLARGAMHVLKKLEFAVACA